MAIKGNFSIGNKSYSSGGGGGPRKGGKASAKRQASANRAKRRASQRQADTNRGIAAARASGARQRRPEPQVTGRDAAARGIATANREKDLQQSVGSLDRRVEKALKEGNTGLAKDLRSRQNRFVKDLAMERARKVPGGTIQGNVRMSSGDPILTSKGFDVFQETIDQDYLDPTRKLQNKYPEQFREMYPIGSRLQMGLPTVQAIKGMFGVKDKPIPYNLPDMPGVRYPLDVQEEPFFGGRSRDPNFDSYPYIAPVEPVTITDMEFDPSSSIPPTEDIILPKQLPAIDPEQRSEVMQEGYGDILEDVQDYNTLMQEFLANEAAQSQAPTEFDYPYSVASNEPLPSYFNLFGQNDENTMNLNPIPVEDFLVNQQAKIEQGKAALKEQFPYLNEFQLNNLYNYQAGTGSASPIALDADPVEFDDYMIRRTF